MTPCKTHIWVAGKGRRYVCSKCGAGGAMLPVTTAKSPPRPWYRTKWAFLAAGAVILAALLLFAR